MIEKAILAQAANVLCLLPTRIYVIEANDAATAL